MRKVSNLGTDNVTVPLRSTVALGTLNDILNQVSTWNNVPKEELIERLRGL